MIKEEDHNVQFSDVIAVEELGDREAPTANRTDESLSQDIDDLLTELENNNVSRNIKEEHKKKLQSVANRLIAVFNKQKELMSDDMEQRKMHIAVAADAVAGSQDANATKTHMSLAEAILHKKINSLTKQLEVADQKSRYVTMQWQADKAKFKETLDSKKSEMDELGHRLAVMESKVRQNEQNVRDRYHFQKSEDVQEEHDMTEMDLVKVALEEAEQEINIKKQNIAELARQVAQNEMDLMAATTRNENLTRKVDEMQANDQANIAKVVHIVKENKVLEEKVLELQTNVANVNQKLTSEQQKNQQAEKSLKEAKLEIAGQDEKFKLATANLQRAVQDSATEKDNIRRELQDSLNQMTREKDYMRIEKEQMQREKSQLVESLKNVAEWSQSMILMYEMKQKSVDNMVKNQSTKFQDMKGEIQRLSDTVNGIIANAQKQLEENKRQLQEQKSKIDADYSKSSNELVNSLAKIAELEEEVRQAKASVQDAAAAAVEAQGTKRQILEMKLENLNHVIESLEADAEKSVQQKEEADKAIDGLEQTIEALKDQLADRDSSIDELKEQQSASQKLSEELSQQVEELKNHILRQEQLLADKETATQDAITAKENDIQELKSEHDLPPKSTSPKTGASPEKSDLLQSVSPNASSPIGVAKESNDLINSLAADSKSVEESTDNEPIEDKELKDFFSASSTSPLVKSSSQSKSTTPNRNQTLSPLYSPPKLQESNKILTDSSSQTDDEPEKVSASTQTAMVEKKHHTGKHHAAPHTNIESSSDTARVPPLVGIVSDTGKKEKAPATKVPVAPGSHEKHKGKSHEHREAVGHAGDKHHESRNGKPDRKSEDKVDKKLDEMKADEVEVIVGKNKDENIESSIVAKPAIESSHEDVQATKIEDAEATKDAEKPTTPKSNGADPKKNKQEDSGIVSDLSESEEDSDLFIPKSKVEEIVHKSLVTYNLYYSEEEAAFTSQYPIDKRFLESLINSFDKIGQKLCEMSDTVHTMTGKLFEADISKHHHHSHIHHHHHNSSYTAAVAAEIEKVIEFCAKRLVIDFEKSKAYSLAKLLESLEDGTNTVENLQRGNSSSDLKAQSDQNSAPRRSGWAKLSNAVESKKLVVPSLSYIDRANESKNINKKEPNSSWNSLRQLMATHAFRYDKKEPSMLKAVTNLMSYQKTAKDNKALTESEQAYLDTIENVSVKLDVDISENREQLRKELKDGNLLELGKISGNNFDRLLNKNLGSVDLVALTKLEHIILSEKDSDSAEDTDDRSTTSSQKTPDKVTAERKRVNQIRALKIQSMILENKIASTIPIFDLLAYKHSTEQYILLLKSMNVLQNLKYYREGGIFRDILMLHRDVIDKCIKSAGGVATGMSILTEGAVDPSMPTHQWPEPFRIRALEVFRLKLKKELQYQIDAVKDAKNMIAQLQQSSENWKTVRDSAISGGGTAAIAAKMNFDKGGDGLGTPSSQRGGAVDSGEAGLSGRRSHHSAKSGDSRNDRKISFPKLLSSSLSLSTQGPSTPPHTDAWTAIAEAANGKLKEGDASKPHSGRVGMLRSPDAAKMDLAYVSEEDDDYDDDELEENWGKTESIVLVVNTDGTMRPSLKKDAAEAQKLKGKTEEHKGHSSVGGKNKDSHSSSSAVMLKPHHEKGLIHTASAVPMTDYAKKALSVIGTVSYITRASRLHSAADKLAMKLLQGCEFDRSTADDFKLTDASLHFHRSPASQQLSRQILKAIEAWQAKQNPLATKILVSCLDKKMEADNETVDLIVNLVTLCGNSSIPGEANEIHSKLSSIIHFCATDMDKRKNDDDPSSNHSVLLSLADMQFGTKQGDQAKSDHSGDATSRSHEVGPKSAKSSYGLHDSSNKSRGGTPNVHGHSHGHGHAQSALTNLLSHLNSNAHQTSKVFVDSSVQTMVIPGNSSDILFFNAKPKVLSHSDPIGPSSRPGVVTASNFDSFNVSPLDSGRAIFPNHRKVHNTSALGLAAGSSIYSARENMLAHLPNGFYFAHFNTHFEICAGVFLATHSQLASKLKASSNVKLSHSKLEEMLTFPSGLRFCHKKGPLSTYNEKLSKAPTYLQLPEIEGFEPMMFPSSFKINDTINLISGEHHMLGPCIKIPFDVVLLQIHSNHLHQIDSIKLPPGLTILEVSEVMKIPEKVRERIPRSLELVQINSVIDLPAGVEISPGVVIADTPNEYTLPYNMKFVHRSSNSVLYDNIIPVVSTSKRDKETLFAQICLDSGCIIKQKPEGFDLGSGVEVLARPQGHSLPAGATPVPLSDYPEGLETYLHSDDSDDLNSNLELIRLAPRFDFPVGCKLSSSWIFFPRPVGLRLPSRVHIVYPSDEFLGVSHSIPALPSCVCRVAMPDVPYNVKLPQHAIAVELLFNWNECCLPEGALLAPGVVVLNPYRFVSKKGKNHSSSSLVGTCNALLVYREPNATLPDTVEKGTSSDMPDNIGSSMRLKIGMEIVKVPVRYELPAGVGIDHGVTLSWNTQISPGTMINENIQVMEWLHGMCLKPGTELVKLQSGFDLPYYLQPVHPPNLTVLPPGYIVIRLPMHSKFISSQRLAGKVTVGLESLVDNFDSNMNLPTGMIYASRESHSHQWPPEMTLASKSELSTHVKEVLVKINSWATEKKSGDDNTKGAKAMPTIFDTKYNVEVVKLNPHFQLPPGIELISGVTVVEKPLWLHTSNWVELVKLDLRRGSAPELIEALANLGIKRVRLRTDFTMLNGPLSSQASTSDSSNTAYYGAHRMLLPEDCITVLLPNSFTVNSWGSYLPSLKSVTTPSEVYLPPAHFLVEKPKKEMYKNTPPGFQFGLAVEYANWILPLLPHNVDIMHIVPVYYLPLGVNVINTSALVQNRLQTVKKAQNFISPIPQLHPMQNVTLDCTVVPVSPYNKYWHNFVKSDPIAMKDLHVFIRIGNLDTVIDLKNTSEFHVHENSDAIVQAVFKGYAYSRSRDSVSQFIESIAGPDKEMKDAPHPVLSTENVKLIILAQGLKEPKERYMREQTKRPVTGFSRPPVGSTAAALAPGTAPSAQMQITSVILHPMVKITKKELVSDPISELNRLLTSLKNQNSAPAAVGTSKSQSNMIPSIGNQSSRSVGDGSRHKAAPVGSTIDASSYGSDGIAHGGDGGCDSGSGSGRVALGDSSDGVDGSGDGNSDGSKTTPLKSSTSADSSAAFNSTAERLLHEKRKQQHRAFVEEDDELYDTMQAIEDSPPDAIVSVKDVKIMQVGIKRLQETADTLLTENESQHLALQSALADNSALNDNNQMMARELDILRNKVFKEDDMKAIINHVTRKYEEKCAEVIVLNHEKNEGKERMQRQIDILTSQVAAFDDSDGTNSLHSGYFPFPIPSHKHGGDHSETSSVSSGMRSPRDRSVASGRDNRHSGLGGKDYHRSFVGAAIAVRVSGSHNREKKSVGGHSVDHSHHGSSPAQISGIPGDDSAHPEISPQDGDILLKQIVRLEQDLKDFKAKAKIDMAHLLEILNLDFINRVVHGVEQLLVEAGRSSTYVVFSASNNEQRVNVPQVIRREPSKGKISDSSHSGFRMNLPENDNSVMNTALASDRSRSPMTAMTDSLSLYEDEEVDDASKSIDDDNKSFVSGSNYGISKLPLSTISEAPSVPKKPAFSTTFPLVINQKTPPSSVDDYIKISTSLSIKPRENAPSLAQNRLGLKVSKILNDVVLEAKKHSQKTMLHGNDHLNLDNTGGNDEVVKSIAGMASSDRDASKEGTLGDKNFVKCVGDIEEAIKKAVSAGHKGIERFLLTEVDDSSTVETNPSSPSHPNPPGGASIIAEKGRERSISASSDDLLTVGGLSIAHNKPLSPLHAAVAEIKGIQSQSQAPIFGGLKKELLGVADNLLALIRLCFDKEKEKHHRTSELLDLENFNLLRLLRAAENKCELKDCLLLEAKTKNSEYGKTVVEGLREKVWQLEEKIEKLLDFQVEDGVTPVLKLMDQMRRYVDLEGKLKFDSLILKKQAISEENKLKKFILSVENHSAADFDESETGLEKLKQAMRHSAFNLRKKYEQAKERAQRTEAEVKSTMDDIAEHIQGYHRNIQSCLPKEMASSLLPSHGSTIDHSPMPMARRLPQLSVSDSSSLLDGDGNSLKSSLSLPATQSSSSSTTDKPARPPLPEVSSAAGRDHLLEKVSRSLSSSHVKFGSAGSMPLAPLHSHLAVKNSTHLQRRGRADLS